MEFSHHSITTQNNRSEPLGQIIQRHNTLTTRHNNKCFLLLSRGVNILTTGFLLFSFNFIINLYFLFPEFRKKFRFCWEMHVLPIGT